MLTNTFRLSGLLCLLAGFFFLLLGVGSVSIPFADVAAILTGESGSNPVWQQIVVNVRLPKAFTAILAGVALSISGLQMQTFFRNPLAGPYVLGLSSGANLGVAVLVLATTMTQSLIMLPGILSGSFATALAAVAGASLVMLLVMSVALKVRNSVTLLIIGIMFGYATSGLVSILMHFSNPEDIQTFIYWTFGSFRSVDWVKLPVLAVCVGLGLMLSLPDIKAFNALLLGESYAKSVGIKIEKVRFRILLSTSLLAGSVTAFCGPIAFLGIAIPHLCRGLFKTSDHRILFPGVIVIGGIVAMASEFVASLPVSQFSLPLNAVTSIFGAPVVIWVVLHQHRSSAMV